MNSSCKSNSPILLQAISRLDDLNVLCNHNNNYTDGKQLESSDIITRVFDSASLYFLKTLTIDSMTTLTSSVKMNKATSSLNPSPSTTSSKYTGILKS